MGKLRVYTSPLQALADWYEAGKRPLPWRKNADPYRIWVSEIMLQQTRVEAVIPYFERWVKAFPTLKHLASAPEEQVLALWQGLGYYSRARNLLKGAKQVTALGGFPKTRSEWLLVPGIGEYTAGAILSIAGGLPEAIVDGNVLRVFARILRDPVRDPRARRAWKWSRFLVLRAGKAGIPPSSFNQALMELGARVCTPRSPKCGECPVNEICRARRAGDPECFPPPKPKPEWKEISEEKMLGISPEGRVFLVRAGKGEWREGLWDLPSVSTPDILVPVGEFRTRHVVTHHRIERITRVFHFGKEEALVPGGVWMDPEDAGVPAGSAFRVTWKEAKKRGFGLSCGDLKERKALPAASSSRSQPPRSRPGNGEEVRARKRRNSPSVVPKAPVQKN